jgi:predicted deacylase
MAAERAPSGTGDEPLVVAGTAVATGTRINVEIPVARLPTDTWMSMAVSVVHGTNSGPYLWLTGAVHGDELNGVEIIRQVLERIDPKTLNGAVIAVPVVNVFGFINESRYLPDRRDLNRSFPGTANGSLASRLAHLVMSEVVAPCSYGIDLHTGSDNRTNYSQIRADLDDEETLRIAEAFGAPVMIHARMRDGSLREAATTVGCHVLLYESGEASRFDDEPIEVGVRGVLGVMAALGMREDDHHDTVTRHESVRVDSTRWVRARRGGVLRLSVHTGGRVTRGETIGIIGDAFGESTTKVKATADGIVIGHTRHPLVSQGDGVVHIAETLPEGLPHSRRLGKAPFARQRN